MDSSDERETLPQTLENLDTVIARAQGGEASAFGEIYAAFREELIRYLFYRTGDADAAEDLAQQIFIKAWQNLGRYRHRGYFKAWMYRIARNHLVDYYRTSRKTLDIEGVEISEPEEAERQLLQAETYRELYRAIEWLPEQYREVLILRFMLSLPAAEVGKRMNRSADAVRALQVRAICALREEYRRRGG